MARPLRFCGIVSFSSVYLQYEDVWAEDAALSMVRRFATSERNRLQDEMTEHFVGNSENARESFGKAAKAMRALPLAKLRVGHILVDRTLLKFLLIELQKAGEHISDLEIPLLSPVIVDLDDKGEPRKKRAKLNDDGTQKKTRNRTGTTMPSRRRFSGPTFRMHEGSSKEGRVRVSTSPYVQMGFLVQCHSSFQVGQEARRN